jgi:hypothetical protein
VLQNNNGAVAVWDMNGFAMSQFGVLANPGTSWHAVLPFVQARAPSAHGRMARDATVMIGTQ